MARTKKSTNGNGRVITTQAQMDKAIWSICNILRRDKCKGARLYVPELTWMLFLKALDVAEQKEKIKAETLGTEFSASIKEPYRWGDWAVGDKRKELQTGAIGSVLKFVNEELFPYLKSLDDINKNPTPTGQQRVLAEIFRNKEKTIISSETNLMDALDEVEKLSQAELSDKHIFPISQALEGLLPRMGDKKNDGGQFFTPREIIRVIINAVNPQIGKTVYDPACGTGGFLIEAFKHIMAQKPTGTQIKTLKTETFWGREDATEAIPICLANMVLHGIELPRIWHGNTLTGIATYGELFEGAPTQFDYIFTNPPFGSKEGEAAQQNFRYKCNKAQILFMQHIIDALIDRLKDGGTCGMVIDEGLLFHTKTDAFTQTKRQLLSDCNLWCIVSLPPGVFVNAGANVKTDLLFFTKGKQTDKIWYYDMTMTQNLEDRKVGKKTPLLAENFDDFFARLALEPNDSGRESDRSWTIDFTQRKREAKAKSDPLKQEAEEFNQKIKQHRETLKAMKKAGQEDTEQYQALDETIKELDKEVRELLAKAKAIDDAVYNIKATNPNAPDRTDKRTPEELMAIIEESQKEILAGLEALRII